MISLCYDKGAAYVWDADDWIKLRSEHRICGSLVGTLPSHPRQNEFRGLPLMLMSEETAVLLENNICELYEWLDLHKPPTEVQIQEYKEYENRLLEEQKEELKKRRIEQFTQKIDIIIAGKRKKLKTQGVKDEDITLNKETLIEEETKRIYPLPSSQELLHIPTQYQWHSEKRKMSISDLSPSVLEGEGRVRLEVFRNLWGRGRYLTEGTKFGCDFLVYPDDPLRHHASHMVRCLRSAAGALRAAELVSLGRLSVSVNKLAVLAYLDRDRRIAYQTLQWHDTVHI